MYKLHVVQAEFGDCLLLQHGAADSPHFILIDGGPETTYDRHLRATLESLPNRMLDLVVLSHVDTDHIIGILDLIADLRNQRANGSPETVTIGQMWHNSFGATIDPNGSLAPRAISALAPRAANLAVAGAAILGIAEGHRLRVGAAALGVCLNPNFTDGLVSVDTAPEEPPSFDTLELMVAGPTEETLDQLRIEWEEWLDTHEDEVRSGDPVALANADQSIPNLSSIVLLARADEKTILLTGDARSDHVLEGLGSAGLLDEGGRLHVDVLKAPHHGSDRNITKRFFKAVTADTYVFSANGKDGNPDLATLIWLVEAARDQERRIKIVATNKTPSLRKFQDEYPADEYGYAVEFMPVGADFMTVTLAE
ncbi:MAG: MBL fold metallo-hydrolase [Acidobacteria bacterium]|nr:MAG: MBL fold metallo-hydrolase [Acidobacteriota bacterium]